MAMLRRMPSYIGYARVFTSKYCRGNGTTSMRYVYPYATDYCSLPAVF